MTAIQSVLPMSTELYEHLLEQKGIEYADGKIVEKPVSTESGLIEAKIIIALGGLAAAYGFEVLGPSVSYRCYPEEPLKFRKPDLSAIRVERLAGIDLHSGFCPIPADLVVEVISPNDLASDVAEKVAEYLHAGFGSVWIVEPRTRTVTVHRVGAIAAYGESDLIIGGPELGSFQCPVKPFFPPAKAKS